MAASNALPPFFRIATPASAANGWLVATMPLRAMTTERRAANPSRSRRLVSNMRGLLCELMVLWNGHDKVAVAIQMHLVLRLHDDGRQVLGDDGRPVRRAPGGREA